MRYRNRIKLAPGLFVNISKSGISTTIGPRGASINIGKSGAYLNTGIPGTGLYSRSKLSSTRHRTTNNKVVSANTTEIDVKIDLDENYEPVIEIYDKNGGNITTQSMINSSKRKPEYKENLKKINERYYNLISKETNEFTDLYKHIIKPLTKQEIVNKIDKLKPAKYSKHVFNNLKPSRHSIKEQLIIILPKFRTGN